MKSIPALLLVGLLAITQFRCTSSPEEPGAFSASYDSLQTLTQQLQDENQYLTTQLNEASHQADSLGALYHALQEATEENALSAEERAFVDHITNLNNELSKMFQTKEIQPVLDYFHDRYTTNAVRISLANRVDVERNNSGTFPEYLNYLVNESGISSLQFSVRDVLEVVVRDNQLAILVFSNDYEVRKEDGEVIRGEDLIQVVAKKYDGDWEIGNYSSILISDYDEMVANR